MKKVYYDIADNFVKDLEKKLNKSIEKNEKENLSNNYDSGYVPCAMCLRRWNSCNHHR